MTRKILMVLGLLMLMGIVIHFRLWIIDYRISATDAELMRTQFDLASREAMDEAAEWRRRYDSELDQSTKCFRELEEVKKSPRETAQVSAVLNKKMEMLQKENMDLLERVKSLKQELETERLNCSVRNM